MSWRERALRPLAAPAFSRFAGRLAQWKAPRPVLDAALRAYASHYGVNLDELAEPIDSFESFNAFFTRRLAPGCRPIDPDPSVMVSPVDGFALEGGKVEAGRLLQVKGSDYSLSELLGDGALARRLDGGGYGTIYLSPASYHRIHSPVAGRITGYRYLPGLLFPVNATAVRSVRSLFARNERLATLIEGPVGGLVALVAVGATNVGSITVTYDDVRTNQPRPHATSVDYARPTEIERAAEVARFNLGSTVVLLWEDPALVWEGFEPGQALRLGERIASPR